MSASVLFRLTLLMVGMGLADCAMADRRSIRVDGFGDSWVEFTIGSAGCAGTAVGSTLLSRLGYVFSGRESSAFLIDDYCQVAQPGTLTSANFFYADEPGLSALFGTNPGDAIKGIRFSFLDRNRFDFDTPPTGFQWGFYRFPSGITVVGLYGFASTTLTGTSYISKAAVRIWDGGINGYTGQYFCFRNNLYFASWNGTLNDPGSACLSGLLDGLFANGFQQP